MIASRIISKIQDFEHELKMGAFRPIDPRRRHYLTESLKQLRRDVQSMGYTPDEIEKNDVYAGVDKVGIQKQYLVVPPTDTGKK
ncbi:MAG: hypothetical protein ACLP19_18975 [Xanthobacteraceae bacterium]